MVNAQERRKKPFFADITANGNIQNTLDDNDWGLQQQYSE